MKDKILLIEDREDRMENLLGDNNKDISIIEEKLTLKKGNEAEEIFEKISNDDCSELNAYDLIMMHYSPLTEVGKKSLDNLFKKESNKKLVYFSGGLSTITYLNDDYECLSLNSSQFYTKNLIDICNHYSNVKDISLLQLAYGPKWELNILIQYRTLLKDLIIQQKKIREDDISIDKTEELEEYIEDIIDKLKPIYRKVMGNYELPTHQLNKYSFIMQIDEINKLIKEKIFTL